MYTITVKNNETQQEHVVRSDGGFLLAAVVIDGEEYFANEIMYDRMRGEEIAHALADVAFAEPDLIPLLKELLEKGGEDR